MACAVARAPAHQVDRGHGQRDLRQAQLLDHFGGVAVPEGREGADHAAALRVVRARVALRAAFGRADLDLDDHRLVEVQQTRFDQRQQGQDAGGGVAAHAADVTRPAQLFPVQLGQPVDETIQPLGALCGAPYQRW